MLEEETEENQYLKQLIADLEKEKKEKDLQIANYKIKIQNAHFLQDRLEKEKNEEIKLLKNSLKEKDNLLTNYEIKIQNTQQDHIEKPTNFPLINNNNKRLFKDESASNKIKSNIRIVVGLDFGTKYSLFSYCHIGGNKNIHTNDIWHGKVGQLRTNTVLQYDEKYKNVKLWGAPALAKTRSTKDDKLVELFNLHLSDLPDNLKPKLPFNYKKAITDYLREIGKVIITKIKTDWPFINFFKDVLLVITIPTVYTENAKEVVRKCAYKAGLLVDEPNLQFITESEAAAAHCIENIPEAKTLRSGTNFMVVNCGDAIDLSFHHLNDKRLSEIILRTSSIRKSSLTSLIEAEFIKYLRKKLGDDPIELLKNNNYGQMQNMIQQFCNHVKIHFTGDSNFSYELDIQDTIPILTKYITDKKIEKKLEKDEWIIKIDFRRMMIIFEPIIQKIFNLINDQLYKTQKICAAMFLVGSLSESKYLLNRFREEFHDQVKIISVPIQPTTSITRGAVTYGLSMFTK
ncbi:hypothetical protein GLOIN_2v1883103 [Rhizophagus clarus]|uniref:Hsp70 family protein n=1 Tax=Rhizophagus clarus TaxID=94130 RepID=A0A8H3LYA4_9GLOM|nr:hypothetical protein GLOIN_2v1883103 [Rhizophagus clarus]